MSTLEPLKFLAPEEVPVLAASYGTPVFVYDVETAKNNYCYFSSIPNAYGLTVRYSIKANPNRAVLQLFNRLGAHFDASSVWEAQRAVDVGIAPGRILLTSQEISEGWKELCRAGMEFDAGSLSQLAMFGQAFPGSDVSIRFNPGFGSGLVKKLTSGGSHSSFGTWHELADDAAALAERHGLRVRRLHFHIGSGHETTVLERTVSKALEFCRKMPSVEILNLGGGYRVAAMAGDPQYDHHAMGARIAGQLERFETETGRRLKLELEPGNYMMALAGSLITRVIDLVDTGDDGFRFAKIDGGLTELIRPSYYGALHPLVAVSARGEIRSGSESYMVSGHCCIAGDSLTPVPGHGEDFTPQRLSRVEIGDFIVVERTGGYAASMCLKNFNSYPDAPEVFRIEANRYALVRKRQDLSQITQNEIDVIIE